MSFAEAISKSLSEYATFSGRARRSQYWYFALFTFLLLFVLAIIDIAIGTYPILYGLGALAIFLPSIGLSVRRMHDTGRSGWFVLVNLIPFVGGIIFIVLACGDSAPDNQYGPNPKGVGGYVGGQPNPYGA